MSTMTKQTKHSGLIPCRAMPAHWMLNRNLWF